MTDKLTDGRRRGFYMVDNEVIDNHATVIGVYGLAVYNLLLRLSGSNDDSFPSYQTIADKLGISRRQAIDSMQKLIDSGLVSKSSRTSEDGDRTSNQYKICDVHALGSAGYAPQVVQDMHHGSAGYAPYQDTSNKTQKKKSLSSKAEPLQTATATAPASVTVTEEAGGTGDAIPSTPVPLAPPPTEQQRKFQLLCNIVGWDYKTITDVQKKQVAQTLGILAKADYTEEHLKMFFDKVWSKDWRWQNNKSYPNLSQVRAEIGKLKQSIQIAPVRTDAKSSGPVVPYYQRDEKKGYYSQ